MDRVYISKCCNKKASKPEAGKDGKGLGKWRCSSCGRHCKVKVES